LTFNCPLTIFKAAQRAFARVPANLGASFS
jgi:hypothetical protein